MAVEAALPALRVFHALLKKAIFENGAAEFPVAVVRDSGRHRAVEHGLAFVKILVLAVAIDIAGIAVLVVA